ncbi:BRCA2-interacting transcriptional repressor EMSY isoform X1 [Pararge aegeria]|uniref:BRCA2-interacting transcriptional repressor EMSY isoform X1 n=1 Tax=Pararge aegeria TaxID=116150 RepID=UPI0019D0AB6D|nr:BRCA2-interacting transcriptional repressor EMSY isoform X1 [Pararge aegeria]
MWPMLLNMTRDECRRTLRRLELEAYSSMMTVFRAQGELEDNRKKLLEELRAVLHISSDRHNAEARRVSNDELLATIAEQLVGSNTALGWISEGRRRVPLMPRGIAQTMYTELADKAAEAVAAENKEIKNRVESEKLIAPKSNEEEMPEPEVSTAEGISSEVMDEMLYPPIAMEDHTTTIWETELICRKRKIPESGAMPEDAPPPIKNMRNIPVNTNQKHLNLSQVYSRFSQPATSKATGHSKHSYNQVSKVSTSKSSQPHAPRALHKQRPQKQKVASKAQKKNQEPPLSPSKQYPGSLQVDYSGPPGSFQASYAQSILGGKTKADYADEVKPNVLSSPGMVTESPTMHLLSQPATAPHELADSVPDDAPTLQAQAAHPSKQVVSGKPCHLIIKKRGEITTDKKIQMSEFKVIQKPTDDIKLISNRPLLASPNTIQRPAGTPGKLVTTKVIGSLPKPRTPGSTVLPPEKMIVVSKASIENRLTNSRIVITSSAITTPSRESSQMTISSVSNRSIQTSEALTPKGIPATDLKVSAKTFVLNPKSGQKMVVVPAKPNKEGQVPLFHFKGVPTAMKLVSVTSQSNSQLTKPTGITGVSKPAIVNAIPSNPKIVGLEPIKTANMADIVPVKGLPTISTPKITNPIVRPVNTKGNLIVVQKGATLGKTLTFSKNGNDVSKIIMGKNVNKLLQTSKPDQVDPSKTGNIIVLELNNEQTARTTTMSEILDSRNTNSPCIAEQNKSCPMREITQDTPVLFEAQITPETCNTSSLDSTTSLREMEHLEESSLSLIDKSVKDKSSFSKGVDIKDSSSVTDWEMDLDTSGKSKDVDKLNSLHLDLGMSSDSENEFIVESHKTKIPHLPAERIQSVTPTVDNLERYSNSSALSRTTRTLLSQLQDEGSSSNDSSFAIKAKCSKVKDSDIKFDKSESEALSKARAKLSEKVAEARSQQKRIDVYSTAITTSDINLDSFAYLDESLMAGDDEFTAESKREVRPSDVLADQLSRLLGDDSANSADSQTVSQTLPLHKNEQ